MPRVSQNKTFLNSGKSPSNAVAFKPSIENVLVLANQTNPFVPPQTSFTPTITPTMTVTPTSLYYFYTLTSCDGLTNTFGRSITSGLTGVYNFENTCYSINGSSFGPSYDYNLDTGTTVSGACENVICLPPTPSPTTTPTLTPTPTTFCCKTCYLVNDTALFNNITYQLTNCDGSNSFYTIESNYSTATTCCVSAVFYSGQTSGFTNPTGITYSNDCSCVNPSPTPTSTQTKTPTQTPTVTPTSGLTPTPTQTSTKTPTPTRTPTRTVTSTVTPTSGLTSTPTPTPSITPTLTPTPTQTSTSTPTPTPSGVPQLGILNTFTEPGFLTLDSVSDSNLIFAFGQTGSTATTFVYTAQTPYSSVTSFSGITGGTSVTSEITNTHIYKAPLNTQFIEVIDISANTSTTLSISGFSGINQSFLSSYDSSTNKVAILAEDGYSVLSIDTTNNSIAEIALISGNTGGAGYKGGITTDGAGNFYVVGYSGQLSVIDSANDTLLNTYSISGVNDYQKITYDSVNLNLFIFSKDFIYIYDTSGSYLDRTGISSYSANNDSGQASIVYNPDNQRVYVAFVNASNALVVLKIKTNDYTVESDKTNYGFTIGSNVRLKYNSSVGVLLTIDNSSFYLLQP